MVHLLTGYSISVNVARIVPDHWVLSIEESLIVGEALINIRHLTECSG